MFYVTEGVDAEDLGLDFSETKRWMQTIQAPDFLRCGPIPCGPSSAVVGSFVLATQQGEERRWSSLGGAQVCVEHMSVLQRWALCRCATSFAMLRRQAMEGEPRLFLTGGFRH
jgi:hypothetical protein